MKTRVSLENIKWKMENHHAQVNRASYFLNEIKY